MTQNHYQVLGVARTAPAADIKRAYRQLVVRYHPDKHGGDPRYEDQFKAVAVAYGVLSDPDRRAQYDFQLTQAARRADEERRRQQYRAAGQHVYGVPMPPPAPLRTRPPADARERHYRTIPRQRLRFTRRDWVLVVSIMAAICLFGWAVKATMDRVTAHADYDDGLRAYAAGEWARAHSYFGEALHFRPSLAPALRRRGEIEQVINHSPARAAADYEAALLAGGLPRAATAATLYRLGQCQADLGRPDAAELSYCRALALAPTLAPAYLARAYGRALNLRPAHPTAALADLRRAQQLLAGSARPLPLRSQQLLGAVLARLGRYDEARATYAATLATYPQDGCTHFLLGRLAQQTGDSAAACEFFRRAVGLGYEYAEKAWQRCR